MLFGGMAYGLIEIIWRGKTHWSMVLTGGSCFTVLISIYQKRAKMSLLKKCLLGGAVITLFEFLCGLIFNIKLKRNIWDYSNRRFNIKGQICPLFSMLWAVLCLPICAISKWLAGKDEGSVSPRGGA